jgi:hypothetical protein
VLGVRVAVALFGLRTMRLKVQGRSDDNSK